MLFPYKKMIFQSLLLLVSVGYLVTAISLGSPVADGSVQPSFFPLIVGSLSILFSGTVCLKEWIVLRRSAVERDDGSNPYAAPIAVVLIFIYIIAFSAVGYFISSVFFVFSMMLMFSSKDKIIQKAVISVVIVTLGYLTFEMLFGVRLPALGA